MKRHIFGTLPLVALAVAAFWFGGLMPDHRAAAQYYGPQGAMMYSSNCAKSPQFGEAFQCYDTTTQWIYYWNGTVFTPDGHNVVVGSLPTCDSTQLGLQQVVTDSTTVSAEGQTCVGSSTHKALAVCLEATWKCF